MYRTRERFLERHPLGEGHRTENFEMYCRSCQNPLGLLHSDPITEEMFLEEGVKFDSAGGEYVTCACGEKHLLQPYLTANETGDLSALEALASARKDSSPGKKD